MAVERVVIEAAPGAAPDAEGRIAVLRKRYDGRDLRSVARLLLDRDNRVVEVTQPSFGTEHHLPPDRPRDRAPAPHPPYSVLRNADRALALSASRAPPCRGTSATASAFATASPSICRRPASSA